MNDVRARAERFVGSPVQLGDLALAFDETTAATVDVHVGGSNFFPPILDDIAAATSSVHINQYGFRPGEIGEQFARALLAKAAEGVAVRVVVDRRRLASRPVGRRSTSGCGPAASRFASCARRGASTTASSSSSTAASAGSAARGSRTTSPMVASTTCSSASRGRWSRSCSSCSSPASAGSAAPSAGQLDALFPELEPGAIPATVLHNAPGSYRPISTAIAELFDGARETLDVVNPYVADKAMIRRIAGAARRGVRVRLFVPASPNNRACAAAQRHHHPELLDAGVRILGHPAMLHAKAFVRDGEEVLAGTCNLEAWSLKRFFEIDVRVRSRDFAARSTSASRPRPKRSRRRGGASAGIGPRLGAAAAAAISPLL